MVLYDLSYRDNAFLQPPVPTKYEPSLFISQVALDFLPYSEPLAIGVNSTEESTRVRRRLGRTSHSRDRHQSFGGGLFEAFARRSAGGSRRLQSDAVEVCSRNDGNIGFVERRPAAL